MQRSGAGPSYTNHIKYYKTGETPLRRMCAGQNGETVRVTLYANVRYSVQREYKIRHYNIAQYIHCKTAEKWGFDRAAKWYEQKPEDVLENDAGTSPFSAIEWLKQKDGTLQ